MRWTTELAPRRERWRRGVQVGAAVALILLLIEALGLLTDLRVRVNDLLYADAPVSGAIVIVAIDDASLARYGRTPTEWPRTVFADLIDRLAAGGARAAAFDVLFAESTPDDASFVDAITRARAGEARLRVIMPQVGIGSARGGGGSIAYADQLRPQAAFLAAIENVGHVDVYADSDNVVRRQLSRVRFPEGDALGFTIAAYYAYLRIPAAAIGQVLQPGVGVLTLTPDRAIPIDDNGVWLPNFYGMPMVADHPTFATYSLIDVIDNAVPTDAFTDRLVMIGVSGTVGALDSHPVPTSRGGQLMPGVEIHANAVETLIQNQPIRPLDRPLAWVLIAGLALIAGVLYAQVRWTVRLGLALFLLIIWLLLTFAWFSTRYVLPPMFGTLLAIALPLPALLVADLRQEIAKRQQSEFLLNSVSAAARQRLNADRIWQAIADDASAVLGTPDVICIINDGGEPDSAAAIQPSTQSGAPASRSLHTIAANARAMGKRVSRETTRGVEVAIPVVWQGDTFGVISARTERRPGRRALALLDQLAAQTAPILENARLLAQAERQNALLNAVIDGSPAGILILDNKASVRSGNLAIAAALGAPVPGDYAGRPLADWLAAAPIDEEKQHLLVKPTAARTPFRVDLKLSGGTFTVDGAPLPQSGGWVLLVNDVSAISELSDLKTRMIRMASHDLKNPLTSVMAYASLIATDDDDKNMPQAREFAGYISNSANSMLHIIDEMLSIERSRSGAIRRDPVILSALVLGVIEIVAPDAERKGQTLTHTIADALPSVTGDYQQLSQAVTNLIGNAIKYTPDDGQVRVRLHLVEGDRVRFEVEDTGYGIPEAMQPNIFREFYRATTRATLHIRGTGLGLSLVKAVIEAHGGVIGFKSVEGVGTTFHFELPILK